MRALDEVNRRLKKAAADLMKNKQILNELSEGRSFGAAHPVPRVRSETREPVLHTRAPLRTSGGNSA